MCTEKCSVWKVYGKCTTCMKQKTSKNTYKENVIHVIKKY